MGDRGLIQTSDLRGGKDNKLSFSGLKTLSLSPNEHMIEAIRSEQSHLRNIANVFVCMDSNFLSSRKDFNG